MRTSPWAGGEGLELALGGSCLPSGSRSVSPACPQSSNAAACAPLAFQLLPTGWTNPRTLSWLLARMGGWCVEPMGTPSPLSSG